MKTTLKLLFFIFCLMVFGPAIAQQSELAAVKAYLEKHKEQFQLSPTDYADVGITHSYTEKETPIKRIYAQQKIGGIDVVGGSFSLHVNTRNNYEVGTNQLLPIHAFQKDGSFPYRTAEFAAKKALEHIGAGVTGLQVKQAAGGAEKKTVFKRNEAAMWDVPARLVYLADEKAKKLKLAWEVQVYEYNKKHYWVMYIEDQGGKILKKVDLVVKCQFDGPATDADHQNHKHELEVEKVQDSPEPLSPFLRNITATNNAYRVYDMPIEAPNDPIASHSLVSGKEDDVASTDGWHRVGAGAPFNYSRGNNVWAFWDPSPTPLGGVPSPANSAFNNGGPLGAPTLTEPFTFDYPINLAQEPEAYRNAAIVNLFYWNNLIHDVYYKYGFNEDAGTFQTSHIFSDGQHGSTAALDGQLDEVLAQAQDGGGTNNANFLTLPDGTHGQMQMYLWTASIPDSMVQITSSSSGIPPAGTKFIAIKGSFASPSQQNLHTNPVVNKQFVIVKKNPLSTVGSDSEGCSTGQQSVALPPGNDVQDKIVLIDRGNCSFVEKVFGAQQGGAAGVIIINNVDGPPMAMGGADAPGFLITIPAVMISKADGEILKAQLRAGATIIGSLKQDNPPAPKRDGDLDNGVIAHEYGHGISNRLTGGRKALGPLGGSEQGGEGWSDFIALHMITRTNDLLPATADHPNGVLPDKGIGTYVVYQPSTTGAGIRPTRYSISKSVNPSLFKDIAKGGEITVPHGVGYIWCTMLYEMMQEMIDEYGFNDNIYNAAAPNAAGTAPMAGSGGNNIAMRLVIEGMKIQPTAPTFQQQRDAILKADTLLYGGVNGCRIWRAFAKRGLGLGARSGSNALGDEVQGFDVPNACDNTQLRMNVKIDGPERVDNNTLATYTVTVRNIQTTDIANVVIKDSIPMNTSFISASDGGTQVGNFVVWNLATLPAGQTKTLTMTLAVSLPEASVTRFFDDHESGGANWTTDPRPDTWQRRNLPSQSYSGNFHWYAREVEDPTHNVWLQMVPQVTIPAGGAKLSFYHKYNTERNYDGGIVEVSVNNGPWTYLPPNKFEKNGYNSVIQPADNPNIGTAATSAFSGATAGYINSVADLSDYAGQQIRVRFRYTCDVASLASGTDPGWYMDDVYIISNLTTITNKVTLDVASGSAQIFDSTGNTPEASFTTIVIENATLPTAISSLSAAAQRNHIRLSWKTFTEVKNNGFEIERKAENETDFRPIGFVKGAGNSTQEKGYIFNDADVRAGIFYHYRLKQKDVDGNFTYTNVAVAKLGTKESGIVFDIMPNPATSVANLVVSTPGRNTGLIRLYDAMGKPITTFNASSAMSSVQRYEVNVSTLPAGTYWVELIVDDVKMTKRLVVNR
ncbi:M36 family metallopeptidase [Aridibaculum aurantiacum]|uniref:M36 family metallopeptidase n=1 Tax=Aridibaculum aurantiacum TaxID=2810307 RepID=UPI001A977879|nr:M36 family metallopeptidase [Aridibaculum aurantiacum]